MRHCTQFVVIGPVYHTFRASNQARSQAVVTFCGLNQVSWRCSLWIER